MRSASKRLLTTLGLLALLSATAQATKLPRVVLQDGVSRLIVDGKSYLIFGGELGNSWADTAVQACADKFFVLGSGLTIRIKRDPDTDARVAGISSIEEVSPSSAAG